MKKRRFSGVVAVAAAGVLALSACSTSGGTTSTDAATDNAQAGGSGNTVVESCLTDVGITATAPGEVSFSTGEDEWAGFNDMTADTYSTYNSVVNAQMRSGFVYFGPDATICRNETFGTFEVTSGLDNPDDPLIVEYTINEDAVWSDGTPITINDYLLDWAAQNPEFLVPGYASGENPDATPVFNHVSTSFAEFVDDGPQGEPGSRTFTVEFNTHYPDYQLMLTSVLPSHVVAQQIGLTGDELAQAILDQDAEVVSQAAEFWNTGWLYEPGQLPDPALTPSAGPYMLMPGGWTANQYITLQANPNYWGTPAATERLTFRFSAADTHVQQLANGELSVIEPQATVDTLAQLDNLGSQVTVLEGSSLIWEHLDYNFADGSIFADNAGGLAAREAFALCAPRQQIVDTLIDPLSEGTELMNAREVFPFSPEYEEVVSAAYDGRYDEVDLDAAREAFAESGLEEGVDLRIGYNSPNPRRAETVQLIAASCNQVGFNVVDVSSDAFFDDTLPNGAYDVALFAWSGSGQVASGQNIYTTNKPQNYGKYSSDAVDEAYSVLASTIDRDEQLAQIEIIEEQLWNDLFGLPLYAHPLVAAHASGLQNVIASSAQDGVSWNAFQWQWAE